MQVDEFKEILQDHVPAAVTNRSRISVDLLEDWSLNTTPKDVEDRIPAYVRTDKKRYQLTTGALLSLASSLQIGKDMLFITPAKYMEPVLNWWFGIMPDKDSPAFTVGRDDVVTSVIKPTGELPEFPLHYLDSIITSLKSNTQSDEFEVHPWYRLETQETRFIVTTDGLSRLVRDDVWDGGVMFRMSVAGSVIPTLSPVFVRRSDKVVMIPANLDMKYSVAKHGQGLTNTEAWVDDTVSMLCAVMDKEMNMLDWLANYDASEHVGGILFDILREASLPKYIQAKVLDNTIENDDSSGYGLLEDILTVMDYSEETGFEDKLNEKIARAGGKLWTILDSRCEECHQLFH